MKVFALFITFLVAVSAVSDHEQWISFKSEHGKIYKSVVEESVRFGIFQENLRKIEKHNAKYDQGEETYMMGVTQFADLTQNEFEKMFSLPDFPLDEPHTVFNATSYAGAAKSVDWRKKGAVFDVQNQGNCGSCWTFSSVGALEGQNAIKHKIKTPLSPQELLDCSGSYGTGGCNGGWMNDAFRYVKDHGIASLKDYPYQASQKTCRNSNTPRVSLKVSGFTFVHPSMESITQAVEHIGPLAISMNHSPLGLYQKGIINTTKCPDSTTHAVLIVGYGTENGIDYWIVKNSWGKTWGEEGYFRIIRNANSPCGIYNHALYPVVV